MVSITRATASPNTAFRLSKATIITARKTKLLAKLARSYTFFNVGKTKVTTQLNINNLLDKYYYTGASVAPSSVIPGSQQAFVGFGAPRTFMGSIRVEF